MGPGSVNAYERSRKEMAQIVARRSPMRMLICTIVLLVAVSACVEAPAPPPAPNMPSGKSDGPPQAASPPATPIDVDGGLARLRTALMREAPDVPMGIDWTRLSVEDLEEMPILAELKRMTTSNA